MNTAIGRLRWAFVGPGGIRAGWRFAIFAGLVFGSGFVVFPLLSLVYTFSDTGFVPGDILVGEIGNAGSLLFISVLLVRLERHREPWFGLTLGRDTLRLFGIGCFWAIAMVTLLLLIPWACGYVSFAGLAMHGGELWRYTAIWLAGMLLVGLGEELTFRGYALSALTRGAGFWPASLLLSLIFGAEHLGKPMENVPDILNIVLLGLFLCYTVRRTGNLWFAIGFHAAFDFFALSFYGSPNTGNNGLPLEHHLLDTHIAGPAWLTGGPQGLEASWLVVPMTLLAFLLIHKLYPEDRYPRD